MRYADCAEVVKRIINVFCGRMNLSRSHSAALSANDNESLCAKLAAFTIVDIEILILIKISRLCTASVNIITEEEEERGQFAR